MANYVTMTELIKITGISKTTLYRLKDEMLPCVRVGNKTLYDPDEVMEYVNQRKDSENTMEVGQVYSNSEICENFHVANMGGIRKSNSKRAIITIAFTHNPTFKHYDYWVDNTLYFYGQGAYGNQDLSIGFNRSLAEAPKTGYTIYLFEKFGPDQYLYRGIVELSEVRTEIGLDKEGNEREMLLFLLKLKGQQDFVPEELLDQEDKAADDEARKMSALDVIKVAQDDADSLMGYQRRIVKTVNRPSAVTKRYVLMRAQGRCELCGKPAPFEIDGEPYLQLDHIIPISRGGSNSIDNLAALCPNCNCFKSNKIDSSMIQTILDNVARDEAELQRLLHKEE